MINATHKNSYSNYKSNYHVSFGSNQKDNGTISINKQNRLPQVKHPARQALLLTLAIVTAQNIATTTATPINSSLAAIESYANADTETNNSTIKAYAPSFITESKHYNDEEFNMIAHRGFSAVAPENTIPAFIAAAERGYNKVECDISWTKDSVPVLLHDETINRTARYNNGWSLIFPKKCSDLKYNEIREFDFGSWKNKKYTGTKIPTFNEFIKCCSDYNIQPYIELKPTSKFDENRARMLVDTVKQAGMEDAVTWISFDANYLNLIKEQSPNCRLGYLCKDFSTAETIPILQSLKTDTNEVFLDIKAKAVNENVSKQLADSGFDFEAWTVDNNEELNNLYMLNCKGITTNSLTKENTDERIFYSDND